MGAKLQDLSGMRFGNWKVIQRDTENKDTSHTWWICLCDCGNIKSVEGSRLKSGLSQSCGCKNASNLKGKKFNRITLLSDPYRKNGRAYYAAICDCGKYIIVRGDGVQSGDIKSCGCIRKTNTYELIDDSYYKVHCDNGFFLIDKDDYEFCSKYQWKINNNGYVTVGDTNHPSALLHRLIIDVPPDNQVDHKNGCRNDCRKENLRICPGAENTYNHTIRSDNTSGTTGVSYDSSRNKWLARITKEGKIYHIGYFDKLDDAKKARMEKELELFGEYSFYNRKPI